MDIKNADVKEKLDKGLISEYEAEVMDGFQLIEARDQILSEYRQFDRMYIKSVASNYKKYVQDAIIKDVMEKMKQSKEKGFGILRITDENIENETLEWLKVVELPEGLGSRKRCSAYSREVEKEWKNMIKKWIKDAIKKATERFYLKERYNQMCER